MAEVIDAALASAGKPCDLGTDPAKYLEKFEDWFEHISLLADSIGITDKPQKLKLILLWGGKDFRKSAKDAEITTSGDHPDTFDEAIAKLRAYFGKHVNLSLAVFKLMHTRQGNRTITEYSREVDELATQCQFDVKPYTKARAMKDAMIFGTSDEKLRQEALAKDFDYTNLIKSGLGYEQSRRASGAMKSTLDEDVRQVSYTQDDVDNIVARVLAGKYSSRHQPTPEPDKSSAKCPNCPPHYRPHEKHKCPARGKTCAACKRKNHFAGSVACTSNNSVRSVACNPQNKYSYDDTAVGRVDVVDILNIDTTSKDNMVNICINNTSMSLFVDSGCKKTLVPHTMYSPELGVIKTTAIKLRPYGTDNFLPVKGEVATRMQAENGAQIDTRIYIVEGHLAEPLLGDTDAKALGILTINKKGTVKACTQQQQVSNSSASQYQVPVAGITDNLKTVGMSVKTGKEPADLITPEEHSRVNALIDKHGVVFNGIGLLRGEQVHFHIDQTVPPVSAPYRPPPLAYREQLSSHLEQLRQANKIEDVDKNEHCPWVSNVVITEKKQKNQIRMNIDMREPNKAIMRTKRHVETIQEIRHKLSGAVRFSEMDMGHGYHQISLAEDSRSIGTFQTHEGLHRFKVLFFGASSATDIFHDRIKAALQGLDGCMSIHDNILVWGNTPEEHEKNLDACLTRLTERGLTLRREKCTFGATEVSWFGWIFSKSGMSADPNKIKSIRNAGKPQNTDDVKSFLQACQFNAKFMFDSDQAYAQITRPLRDLTKKNAHFRWTPECEKAYQTIMQSMTSNTALRPFQPDLKTIHIADAGPEGIASSIFQEQHNGTWVPVDHASRALTPCEKNYSQTEKESLAQSWGMNIHRYYLLGIKFVSYTDHQPLVPIYSGKRKGNARVERHRLKAQGFQYDMQYLPGKENPCDYQSRHPLPLSNYSDKQLAGMVIDNDDELCISKIVTDDLPDAVTLKMVQKATAADPILQKLIKCIRRGYISNDPDLVEYRQVFNELATTQDVILRGEKLLIPDAGITPGSESLRQLVVELAHEGHQGTVKCKQLLRSKIWFPHLDKMVEDRISRCLGCQATTYTPRRDPLQPSILPDRPWQVIDMDFWGPLPSGEYILVMIDEYSRYPEVEFVTSTGAQAVVPHIDKVFSTHGFPEVVKTDGGPPFNGNESHEYQLYMKWAGIKTKVVSPEDPEANGLAENFMKVISKTWHIAKIEGKNYKQEIYKFLRHYRATPHTSTGKAPAEVLFNRKFHVRLPEFQKPAHDPQLRQRNDDAKAKQKQYKDAKTNVKPHNIQVGDKVLLLQKQSKTKSRYDPEPFEVIQTQGTQITARRGDTIRKRDSQKFKKIDCKPGKNYKDIRYPLNLQKGAGIDFDFDHNGANLEREQAQDDAYDNRYPPLAGPIHGEQYGEPPRHHVHMQAGPLQGQRANAYEYPNHHLDPHIDITLQRHQRNRQPTKQYDANTGTWN